MFDIQKEIRIMLVSERSSMKKVVEAARGTQLDIPSESTISTQMKNKRIRFQTVLHIAELLGYEVVFRKKQK